MDLLNQFMGLFLNLDVHIQGIIEQFGTFAYVILFLTVMLETGVIVMAFLPGDTLLFACGALAARGSFDVWVLFVLFVIAAILGDALNYAIGSYVGPKVFERRIWFLKKDHLERTREFYRTQGGRTIVIARFLPFIRTLAPFVAGVGSMPYRDFCYYNVVGAFLWSLTFVFGGYFFGTIPVVARNFELVIVGVFVASAIPPILEWSRHRWRRRRRELHR